MTETEDHADRRRFALLAAQLQSAAGRFPELEVALDCGGPPDLWFFHDHNREGEAEFRELAGFAGGLITTSRLVSLEGFPKSVREELDPVLRCLDVVIHLGTGRLDHERLAHEGSNIPIDIHAIVPAVFQNSFAALERLLGIPCDILVREASTAAPETAAPSAGHSDVTKAEKAAPLTPAEREGLRAGKNRLDKQGKYLGESDAVLHLFGSLQRLFNLAVAAPVITLLGETGCGKTLLADIIHAARTSGKEDAIGRCNAADVVGGDFNIAKGRFVGYGAGHGIARIPDGQVGLLEACKGSSILIDEFTDLPSEMQTLLLTVFDGREIQKVGKGWVSPPHPLIMLTSNRHPEDCVSQGKLRNDFWRRVRTYSLRVPPLRERKEDILVILRAGKIRTGPMEQLALLEFDWPGNIRELSRVLNMAVDGDSLRFEQLPPEIQTTVSGLSESDAEKELLEFAIELMKQRGMERGKCAFRN